MIKSINHTIPKKTVMSPCLEILFLLLSKSTRKREFAISVAQTDGSIVRHSGRRP